MWVGVLAGGRRVVMIILDCLYATQDLEEARDRSLKRSSPSFPPQTSHHAWRSFVRMGDGRRGGPGMGNQYFGHKICTDPLWNKKEMLIDQYFQIVCFYPYLYLFTPISADIGTTMGHCMVMLTSL